MGALARLREATARLGRPRPKTFEISRTRLQTARQAVSGRLVSWQTTQPHYPQQNLRTLFGRYRGNSVFRRCVDLLMTEFARGIPRVVDDSSGQPVENSEAVALFRKGGRFEPTPARTEKLLLLQWIQDFFLTGNAIWEKVRWAGSRDGVAELWRLDPSRIAVVPHPTRVVDAYLYNVGGKWWPISPRDVVHWMFPDPVQPYFGIPPIYSALRSLVVDDEIVDHFKVTMQNYGVPAAVLMYEDNVEKEDADEAIAAWNARYGGGNRGGVGIVGGAKEIKVIGMDFSKMAISELVATSESRIASVHGVPLILLGRSGTQSDPTRANYATALRHFWYDTVSPLHEIAENLWDTFLLREFDPEATQRFAIDTSHVQVLIEARLDRAEQSSKVFSTGLVSRHRAQRLAGIQVHGPDVFYRPGDVGAIVEGDATSEVLEVVTM